MPGPILNSILLLLLSISTTSNGAEYHPTAVLNNKNNSTKTLFYLKTDITTSLSFAWQQAALCSMLFQFAVSHNPWVLVHCTAVNNMSLLTMHKGAGNVFLQPTDSVTIISNLLTVHQSLLSSASQFEGTTNSFHLKKYPYFLFIYIWLMYTDIVQHHSASFTVNGNALALQPQSLSTNSPGPSQPSILVGDKWLVLSSTRFMAK
jgi:hypothetical protein